MRVSQRKGSGLVPKRPPRQSGPERLATGCVDCGGPGGEHGLDPGGLCVECCWEDSVAQLAVTSLIDHGIGVTRAGVEAL